MKERILPTIVLTVICAVVCGLLAAVNGATRERIAQAERDKVQRSLTAVFGEGTYTPADTAPEGVTAVYTNDSGLTIYDITADGYAKGGLRVLVGLDEAGCVASVGIVSCGETAGVGTKVTEPIYLAQFAGAADRNDYPDAISGATFSSRGLAGAVALAQQYAKEGQS